MAKAKVDVKEVKGEEAVTEVGEVVVAGDVKGTPHTPFFGRVKKVSEISPLKEKDLKVLAAKDALVTEADVEKAQDDTDLVALLVAKDAALQEG